MLEVQQRSSRGVSMDGNLTIYPPLMSVGMILGIIYRKNRPSKKKREGREGEREDVMGGKEGGIWTVRIGRKLLVIMTRWKEEVIARRRVTEVN